MKNLIFCLLLALPGYLSAQIGIKAGLNFANVTKTSSINNDSRTGFHAGLFLATSNKSILSSRTEIIFSRQGYDYKTNMNTGNVNLDYIMVPQFMAINITKYFQIQVGAQVAYLISAKVDSMAKNNYGGMGNTYGKIMDFYNRFDYGFGGGIEIHPVSGLLIGARVNISLGQLYKDPESYTDNTSTATTYDFVPKVNVKNNVFQIFAGWRFGKQSSSKKKSK
jgi:hypothetical protein